MDSSQNDFIIDNVEITLILNYANFGVLAFLLYDTGNAPFVSLVDYMLNCVLVLLFNSEVSTLWVDGKTEEKLLYSARVLLGMPILHLQYPNY